MHKKLLDVVLTALSEVVLYHEEEPHYFIVCPQNIPKISLEVWIDKIARICNNGSVVQEAFARLVQQFTQSFKHRKRLFFKKVERVMRSKHCVHNNTLCRRI